MITTADIDNWFRYHPPTPSQRERYEALRDAAKTFAQQVLVLTPAGADQSAAIRKIREAVMTANAAIACEPRADYDDVAAFGLPDVTELAASA